jgi:hypothetical protein
MKGLLVNTFRSFDCGKPVNCTNGGLSGKCDAFILTGEGIAQVFNPSEEHQELVLDRHKYGLRAVPRTLLESGAWVMFGGNFVYSSDSRFPSEQPIKIFDRVELAGQSALMD